MIIKSDRLSLEIANPGKFPANTSRFDWSGFVTSIVLDGKYEFCTKEPTNLVHPSTGGEGLCNEYLYPELCDAVKAGEKFPKFGIGLFEKPDDETFCFFRKYKVDPFPVKIKEEANVVTFITEPREESVYKLVQEKRIEVQNNTVSMTVTLKNIGNVEISMEEFCHNFLTIEKRPIGPRYHLEIPYLVHPYIKIGTLCGENGHLTFSDYNDKATLLQLDTASIGDKELPYMWTLMHDDSPVYIKCFDDFKPAHLDVWSIDHIISVETFYPICLKPGEEKNWVRHWTFCVKGEE